MNEDRAASDPGCVDEVVAYWEELGQVLSRGVWSKDTQMLLVLEIHKSKYYYSCLKLINNLNKYHIYPDTFNHE